MPRADFERGLKICSACKKELPLDSFYKDKQHNDGLSPYCKECYQIRKPWKRYYNLEKTLIYKRERYREDEEFRKKVKEHHSKYIHSEEGHKRVLEIQKSQNRKRVLNGKQKEWMKNKRQSDPSFAMSQRFRARLGQCVRKQGWGSEEILGCSWEQFKSYLESKFQPGMTWENRDQWDIDHIIPVSYFRKVNGDMRICFHYMNLQPLWKEENRNKKKCKVPENYLERIEGIKSYMNSFN